MNGGIHDAVNLAERLAAVWHGGLADSELDRSTCSAVWSRSNPSRTQTIQNKRNLETASDEFRQDMRELMVDRKRARDYLLRVSMIARPAPRRRVCIRQNVTVLPRQVCCTATSYGVFLPATP